MNIQCPALHIHNPDLYVRLGAQMGVRMKTNLTVDIQDAMPEELEEIRQWLSEEASRLEDEIIELEEQYEKLQFDKKQFQMEMKLEHKKLQMDKKRIKQDELFFDKKKAILESGFRQLDVDKRKLEQEKKQMEKERKYYHREEQEITYRSTVNGTSVTAFFNGVTNTLALKKRYKDLIKIFHPDNLCGDHETVQMINEEYDYLKKEYHYD